MKKLWLCLLTVALFTNLHAQTQTNVKALVGGTLIDGYGSKPIRNSVVIIEGDRIATYWPSVAMRVSDQVGTVSEGKYADIIAVRGDVLRHIDLLQNVDIVIKHGRRWK